MIAKKYREIMEREEAYRNKWALTLTISLSFVIFTSFAFYKGFVSFGSPVAPTKSQVANVISAEEAPSPIESSKDTFRAAFYKIDEEYQSFKESMLDVLVPFVTGIEVYERK